MQKRRCAARVTTDQGRQSHCKNFTTSRSKYCYAHKKLAAKLKRSLKA